MKKRFLHLDFKGIVPAFERLDEYFQYFKKCGFEGIVFEFDCRVRWRSWPGAGMPEYTAEQAAQIVTLAESYGFETIPLMQIQGHLEWALGEEAYAGLRENNYFTLCPSASGAREQLFAWMQELREMFPNSQYIHLGADEVLHMGLCPLCRAKCGKDGDKFRLYLEHASTLCSHALTLGLRPMIWGDMLLGEKDPAAAAKQLPESTIIVDWKYWGAGPHKSTDVLQKSGREVWGASGVQCAWYEHFRQILPFYEDRLENILGWHNFDGTVIHTTWGRAGNKYGVYPPWLMTLPLFVAAGDPERWEKHPWKEGVEKVSRLLRRALEFELVKLPAEIRQWETSCRLEEESREYLALGVEFQILVNQLLEVMSDYDSQLESRRFVGVDPRIMERDLLHVPRKIQENFEKIIPRLAAVFDRNQLAAKEEFLAEFSSQFRRLKEIKPFVD